MTQSQAHLATQARIAAGICGVPSVINTKCPSWVPIRPLSEGPIDNLKWSVLAHRKLTPWELGNYFPPREVEEVAMGCGVLLGKYSIVERDGVLLSPWCLDFDDMPTWIAFVATCAEFHLTPLLERCLVERSIRGIHLAALVNGLYPTKNLALYPSINKAGTPCAKPLIELKTNFVKTAPSKGYTPVRGDWADLPVTDVEDVDHLIHIAMGFHRLPAKPVEYRFPFHTPLTPAPNLIKPVKQYRFTSLTRNGAVQMMSQEEFVTLTHTDAAVEKQAVFLGIPPPSKGMQFACVLPGHGPESHPSMSWLRPRHLGETWKICCHHGDGAAERITLSLVEYYYQQCTGSTTKLHPSEFGVWQAELLIESGVLPRPTPKVPPMPKGLSAYGRQAYEATVHLYSTRMYRNPENHTVPFGHTFMATFHGMSAYAFRLGLHETLRKAVWHKAGIEDGLTVFRPGGTKLRRAVKRSPLEDTRNQTEAIAVMEEREVQVASEAAPLRHPAQKKTYFDAEADDDDGGVAVADYDDSGCALDDVEGLGPWDVP